MTICCPGPSAISLAWAPCGMAEALDGIDGYIGLLTRTRGDRCPVARLTWATSDWTHDSHPTVGDRVTVGGISYFVDSSVGYGCTVTLQLCRPILECPDCTSTIYRLSREDQQCVDPLSAEVIDSEVETQVCITDRQRRIVDNAEIQLIQARICLDSDAQVEPGDLVVCGVDVWRIDRVESPCSSTCLLTLLAIREPWGIYDSLIPPQPEDYVAQTVALDLPSIEITTLGDIDSPAQDHLAFVELDLPGLTLAAVGTFHGDFVGSAMLSLPTAIIAAVGTHPQVVTSTVDLSLPTAEIAAVGQHIPQLVGSAELSLPTAEIAAVGDIDSPPTTYEATVDLTMSGAQVAAVGSYIDQYNSTIDMTISGLEIAAVGQSKVNVEYEGSTSCPIWVTMGDDELETQDGDDLIFAHQCGLSLPGVTIGAVGTVAWGYIGSASLSLPTASIGAVGHSIVDEEYQGSGELDLPAAQVAAVGLYSLSAQFLGRVPGCGPWGTDDGDVIVTDLGEEITFGEDCAMGLPGVSITSSGTFIADSAAGSAAIMMPCAKTEGFVQVAPAPVQQFNGSATLDLSGITINSTADFEPPPTATYDGNATLDISGIDINATGDYSDPPALVIGMTGGNYVLTGAVPHVVYPLTDTANFSFGCAFPVDDNEALFLTLPIDVAQGADISSAILRARVQANGFGPLHGTITAWDTDHAPDVDQNWSPDQVRNLPRTSASVDVAMPTTTSIYEMDIDVTSIVAEIIARPGWQPGCRIMLILEENGLTSAGCKVVSFDVGVSQTEPLTELIIEVGGFVAVNWTRANYWYFENIESGCSQGSANPLIHSSATEMILRTQTNCGPSIVRRWALGFAVIGLNESVNEAQFRFDTTALAAGALPYTTTSVTAYYVLTSFNESTYQNSIDRANLRGGLTIPWHWSYGEDGYVIDGFGPLLQQMQFDPDYTLGDSFRIVIVPNDTANWDNNPSAPIQGHKIDVLTPILEYSRRAEGQTPLASPSWLVEAEDYTPTKIGAAYSSTTYQTLFKWDLDGVGTVTTVTNSTQLASAISAAKSNTSIKGIHLQPGNYTWPINSLSGLNRANNDAFFIRTTPGAATQAVMTQIREESGNFSGIAFVDLDVSAGGLWLQGAFGGAGRSTHDVLIERCHGWVVIQGENLGNLTPGLPATNVMVRLCTLVDHWSMAGSNLVHGIYTWNTDWILLEGNILDHNGWDPAATRSTDRDSGGPTSQKHNAYLNRPAVPEHFIIRFNWNSRASANGFHMKCGGVAYRNIMSCNPINFSPGYGGDGNFGAFGVVTSSVVRDNLVINGDNLSNVTPMGVMNWLTCIDNALIDSNTWVYANMSSTNSTPIYLERNFPITVTVSNNVGHSIHPTYLNRGAANFTPSVTNSNNKWTGTTITPAAQSLAYTLGAKPTGSTSNPVHVDVQTFMDNLKTSRRRLGIDIEQLKAWMQAIVGGIS